MLHAATLYHHPVVWAANCTNTAAMRVSACLWEGWKVWDWKRAGSKWMSVGWPDLNQDTEGRLSTTSCHALEKAAA